MAWINFSTRKIYDFFRNAYTRVFGINLCQQEEEDQLPVLTSEMKTMLEVAMQPESSDVVLVSKFKLEIQQSDIQTLLHDNWLNDQVINFYMSLLEERGTQSKFPRVLAMNTFFYPRLILNGHQGVKRWTKNVDIFLYDIIIVPVHVECHWTVCIIDFRKKAIQYFDSLGLYNVKCLTTLEGYLKDERMDKRKSYYDTTDWKLECAKNNPQQGNNYDCGVYSCVFAEYVCADRRITFSQRDIPYFRLKMAIEIFQSRIL